MTHTPRPEQTSEEVEAFAHRRDKFLCEFVMQTDRRDTSASLTRGVCPSCGAPLTRTAHGMSLVVECRECGGFSVATTNTECPQFDDTQYDVQVRFAGERKLGIARLAIELGLSLTEARTILDTGGQVASKVSASRVLELKALLEPLGFELSTTQDFPWW